MSRPRVLAIDGGDLGVSLVPLEPLAVVEMRSNLTEVPPDGIYAVLIADYDHLTDAEQELLLQAFQGLQRQTRLLLVSEQKCRAQFPRLFGARALTNLVARNGQIDPENLAITVRKLLEPDIFGLQQYVDPIVRSQSWVLTRSDQKAELLGALEDFSASHDWKGWLTRLLCSVADEFFTNALYNAPVDAEGRHRFAKLPRSDVVGLSSGEHVEVRVATDGKRVAISTSDPFGSLTPERLLDYLARCFRRGEDQVESKPGGAGLGFYTVFESLTHFVVNLAPGRRTEVIGILDIERSYRQFASRSKSFNIFMIR